MKPWIIFVFTQFIFLGLFAQDVIVKKNGDEINVKILEIGISEIKYKKSENMEGPTYSESKKEIFYVKFANGSKEVISNLDAPPAEPRPQILPSPLYYYPPGALITVPQKIDIEGNGYYQNGNRISYKRLYNIFSTTPIESIKIQGMRAVKHEFLAKQMTILSIPLITAGLAIGLVATIYVNSFPSSYSTSSYQPLQIIGFSSAGIGTGLLVASIYLNSNSKKRLISAIDLYNKTIK